LRATTVRIEPGRPRRTAIIASADLELRFVGLDPTASVRVTFDDGTIVAERDAADLRAQDDALALRIERGALSRGRLRHESLRVLRSKPAAPHLRSPAQNPSGEAFELVATILARRPSLRAIEGAIALGALALCAAWVQHLRLAEGSPSAARKLADIVTALVALAPIAGWLGAGRSRSAWLALALAPLAITVTAASRDAAVIVVDRRAIPERITRYLPHEVRRSPPDALFVRGVRVALGPRCALAERDHARTQRKAPRWIITDPLRYRETSPEFARGFAITSATRCAREDDGRETCCIELDASGTRSIEATPPADWTTGDTPSRASLTVTIGRGPRIDRAPRTPSAVHVTAPHSALIATVHSTFAPGIELRWDRVQPSRAAGFSLHGAGRTEPFSLRATAVDGETFSVECPADGVFVHLLDAPIRTVSRIWSSDGEARFDDQTGLGANCERAQVNAQDLTVEVPTRNGGGRRYSAAWARFRYARAPRNGVDVMDADLHAAAGNARCIDVGCSRSLRAVRISRALIGLRTLEFAPPRARRQTLWTANDPSADLAFVCACDHPARAGSNTLDLELVATVGGGADGRSVHAQLENRDGALELVESRAPMPVGPDCCRLSDRSTVDCEMASMMLRVPHQRRLLRGARAPGCGAVYELVPARGLRGP
jgi:hypothetical protein